MVNATEFTPKTAILVSLAATRTECFEVQGWTVQA
jgi:hypothetical protein